MKARSHPIGRLGDVTCESLPSRRLQSALQCHSDLLNKRRPQKPKTSLQPQLRNIAKASCLHWQSRPGAAQVRLGWSVGDESPLVSREVNAQYKAGARSPSQSKKSKAILMLLLLHFALNPIRAGDGAGTQVLDERSSWKCGTRFPVRSRADLQSPFPNDPDRFWPNGRIPYSFDQAITATQQQSVLDAMKVWSEAAGVHFVSRSEEDGYIHITTSSRTNVSFYEGIGYDGGKHDLAIWESHWNVRSLLLHELGHALGFWHTQSRQDRDGYVRIESGHIEDGQADQFEIKAGTLGYGPYDFASIMHYRACAFSNCDTCLQDDSNCRTITVLPPYSEQWQRKSGAASGISEMDRLTMSLIYAPATWTFVDVHSPGDPGQGTFFDPYRQLNTGEGAVPKHGTLVVQPGTYVVAEFHAKAMTIRAPLGGVTLTK